MSETIYGFAGLGLIGGSLARSLKKTNPECRIIAFARSKATIETALQEGIIDEAASGPEDPEFAKCRILFLCAPVGTNIENLRILSRIVPKECTITDVGSVKTAIHEEAAKLGIEDHFIGGHPMTGSEKSGLSTSTDHLFENAFYILTPTEQTSPERLEELRSLTESLGALPMILSCREHDYTTAAISHLPHVIAAALVNTVHHLDSPSEYMKIIAAGGFRDITRIASSSPDMWEQICVDNCENIHAVMDEFLRLMTRARDEMDSGNGQYIWDMFRESKDYRDSFSFSSAGPLKKEFRIYCDIIDEAGALATVTTILAVSRINIRNIGIVHNRMFEEGALRIEFYSAEHRDKAVQVLRHHRYTVWDQQ